MQGIEAEIKQKEGSARTKEERGSTTAFRIGKSTD